MLKKEKSVVKGALEDYLKEVKEDVNKYLVIWIYHSDASFLHLSEMIDSDLKKNPKNRTSLIKVDYAEFMKSGIKKVEDLLSSSASTKSASSRIRLVLQLTELSPTEPIFELIDRMVDLKMTSIPLNVTTPSPFTKDPTLIRPLHVKAKEAQLEYFNVAREHFRIDRYCTFPFLLWVNLTGGKPNNDYFENQFKNRGVVITQKNSREEMAKWLSVNTHLKENPLFRVVVDITIGGSEQHLGIVQEVREGLSMNAPILIYYTQGQVLKNEIYDFNRVKASTAPEDMLDLGTMGYLEWAADNDQESQTNQPIVEGYFNVFSVSCANIAPKDLNGLSDPYIIFTVNDTKKNFRTKTKMKTLNPVWPTLKCSLKANSNSKVSIEVWDWDMLSRDDFEGQIEIDLQTICSKLQNGTVERTYALKPKKSSTENVTGTITLSMGFSTESQDLDEKPKKKSRSTSVSKTSDKKPSKPEKEAGPRRHFGLPLQTSFENAKKDNILHVTKKCVNYLLKHVTEEGIIRKTGNKTFMLQLAAQIDEGEDVNFDEVLEPHDINSLMKYYFSSLPDRLFPVALFPALRTINVNTADGKAAFEKIWNSLPAANKEVFMDLSPLVNKVAQNTDMNLMTMATLQIVLAPTLIIPEDVQDNMEEFGRASKDISDTFHYMFETFLPSKTN
jgi:hypothetical protein